MAVPFSPLMGVFFPQAYANQNVGTLMLGKYDYYISLYPAGLLLILQACQLPWPDLRCSLGSHRPLSIRQHY